MWNMFRIYLCDALKFNLHVQHDDLLESFEPMTKNEFGFVAICLAHKGKAQNTCFECLSFKFVEFLLHLLD